MSRTLNDDFEDDGPGGVPDLQQGSPVGHGQPAPSPYEGGGGMSFDDDFDDAPQGSLELDVPSAPPANPVPPPPVSSSPGPNSSGRMPAVSLGPQSSGSHPAAAAVAAEPAGPPPPPPPAALVAKYPAPPAKPWEAPVYFVRVVLRQWELRQDLTALRRRRSPDVRLYEDALGTYDKKTFAIGMAISTFGVLVALGLFLIPVWKRFFFND